MKHINITNWQGNITDWTKFNYIYGGLDDTLADRVNLRIPGTNLRNYIKKSDNLIPLPNIPQADFYGLNYKVENGVISIWGTATNAVNLWLELGTVLPANTRYYMNFFYQGTAEGRIIYNIAKQRSDWTNRIVTNDSQFTFIKDFSMSAICLQLDANKQYNCTFKPMVVYGNVMPTTYEPYGSMVMVENVAKVDLGTLNWVARKIGSSVDCRMMSSDLSSVIALSASDDVPANISCPEYKTLSANNTYLKNTGISVDGSGSIAVYDENYNQSTSASAFKEAMNGVYVNYELKEPKVTIFGSVDLGTLNWSGGQPSANTLGMVKPSDPAPTAVEDSMSLDELLEPANEER